MTPGRIAGAAGAAERLGGPRRAVVVALLLAVLLVPIKALLNAAVGGDIGLLPAVVLVLAVAWQGGLAAAMAAIAVVTVSEAIVLEVPAMAPTVFVQSAPLRLLLFVVVGSGAAWAIQARRAAEREARLQHADAVAERDRADLLARRLGALQAVGAELAQAESGERVVELLVDHSRTALQSDATFLLQPATTGRHVVVLGSSGLPEQRDAALTRLPLDLPLPATDVIRTGRPVFIEHPDALAASYGHSYRELGLVAPRVAMAVVPLRLEDRTFGALGFSWNRPCPLPPDRQAFIEAIARVGAAALDRARLGEQEREAYRRLQASRRRLDLLSEAGRVFGLTLDFDSTLRQVGALAVPELGDVCVVDVLEGEHVRRLVAPGSEVLATAAATLERQPIRPGADCPIARVLESGIALTSPVDQATSAVATHDPEQAAAIRTIGARWLHVAPLRSGARTIGTISLFRRADHPYDPEEVSTVAQLAERAGHALENARLHAQVHGLADREARRAAELEAVLGAVGEGFLVVDPEGVVRSVNAAATRLLGGPVPTCGALLDRLLDAGDAAPQELSLQPREYRLRHRPAAWVEVVAYPVRGPGAEAISTVVVCRDVTAFRQGQALREAFMGLLSHELRTPVTTIYGGAAVLARRGAALDAATAGEVLADIAAEADRLYRLVEDLLVLARFDEGFEVGRDPVLLQRLVPAVVEQERTRWPNVELALDVAPDLPAVGGDETSITQVLRNLLSNAAKYGGPGSRIEVRVEPAPGGVAVRVLDQGPGIDPEERDQLFDAFYRSPTTVTLAGGAGIGLYVSRRLVDVMGGRIWAAPREGRGSEFGFALDAYPPEVDARRRRAMVTSGAPSRA